MCIRAGSKEIPNLRIQRNAEHGRQTAVRGVVLEHLAARTNISERVILIPHGSRRCALGDSQHQSIRQLAAQLCAFQIREAVHQIGQYAVFVPQIEIIALLNIHTGDQLLRAVLLGTFH